MRRPFFPIGLIALLAIGLLSTLSSAKDVKTTLEQCPAPVQNIVRQYSAAGTFQEIEVKKGSGEDMYEAKFVGKEGQKIKIILAPNGQVVGHETKPAKDK
jgi:hypothetical protein